MIINLNIKTMDKGILHLYNDETEEEIEIDVDLEFDYDPPEKQTLEYPGCDEELRLVMVTAPFGYIDIDTIQNMDEFNESALECMHEEALESRNEEAAESLHYERE